MNKLSIIFIVLVFISCDNKKGLVSNIKDDNLAKLVNVNNSNYFDFDKVDYYFKDIEPNVFFENYKNPDFKNKESDVYKYMQIVEGYYPNDLLDEAFITNLTKFGYEKKILNSSRFGNLNLIFSETKCDDGYAMACTPIYRDILIFYKENKIVGIAKICFGCRQYHIIGTDKNLEDFGQCGGYEELQDLLSK
jgi:hypothetical protein